MREHKKYLLLVYYGYEGWAIVGEADTQEEILEEYKNKHSYGMDVIVVKNIPVVLKIEEE